VQNQPTGNLTPAKMKNKESETTVSDSGKGLSFAQNPAGAGG